MRNLWENVAVWLTTIVWITSVGLLLAPKILSEFGIGSVAGSFLTYLVVGVTPAVVKLPQVLPGDAGALEPILVAPMGIIGTLLLVTWAQLFERAIASAVAISVIFVGLIPCLVPNGACDLFSGWYPVYVLYLPFYWLAIHAANVARRYVSHPLLAGMAVGSVYLIVFGLGQRIAFLTGGSIRSIEMTVTNSFFLSVVLWFLSLAIAAYALLLKPKPL